MQATFKPSSPLSGSIVAPADKSISHRIAMFGAISKTPIEIENYLLAEDTLSTLAALRTIGAKIERSGDQLKVQGVGMRGPDAGDKVINVGNAGTLMRLLPGWLAGQEGRTFRFDGDDSIRRRPIDRIAKPLSEMGAKFDATQGKFAPFAIEGCELNGITYTLPVASAQVKSCLLLAGLVASGPTTIIEPEPSRDHTERLLARMGVPLQLQVDQISGQRTLTVNPINELCLDGMSQLPFQVPGDLSSAAFAMVGALLIPGSEITVENVGVNWTRTGLLEVLQRMGARIDGFREHRPKSDEPQTPVITVGQQTVEEFQGGVIAEEPIAHLTIKSAELVGTTVTASEVPLLIDELPLVALVGCFAEGRTVVQGAEELRYKESDRIATVVEGLRALGGKIEATEDGFVVEGTGGLRGGVIDSHGDHRLAMLGAIAGLASVEGVTVKGVEAASVSYPGFEDDLLSLTARR